MPTESNLSADRLLGRGQYAREGRPEPTLLPHFALLGPEDFLPSACEFAGMFGRGNCAPFVAWPDLGSATLAVAMARPEKGSDPISHGQ